MLVEEVLRYDPPLHLFTRYAKEDVTIDGHRVMRGDKVGLLLGAANHDPRRFPDPARFDMARPVRTNMSFGAGIHFCIGAPLARIEIEEALRALFTRLPGLALSTPTVWRDSYHFRGLETLQVRW